MNARLRSTRLVGVVAQLSFFIGGCDGVIHGEAPATELVSGVDAPNGYFNEPAPVESIVDDDDATALEDSGQPESDRHDGGATDAVEVGVTPSIGAPSTLTASVVADNTVELWWTAAVGSGTVAYSVLRSLNPGSGFVPIAKGVLALKYVDATAVKGTRYYYAVQATIGSVSSPYSGVASVFVSTAKMLFKTNFGPGVTLGPPSDLTVGNAWQRITGTDLETGYTFPVKGLGSDATLLQLIGPYGKGGTALTYSNVNTFFGNKIQSVVGPRGNPVNALFLSLQVKEEKLGDGFSQVPLIIRRPWTIGDPDVYLSYWYKFPADLATKLDTSATGSNWRVLFEWKSGGWSNTGNGDYRMITSVIKGKDGILYWKSQWDNYGNLTKAQIPTWENKIYWSERNSTVPIPIGKWFKVEVFWHRSGGPDGRYWLAVNGQKVTDHFGPNLGDFKLPVTRIMVNNAYSGGYGPVEGHLINLQIWNGFPCGNGIPCG